MIIDQNPIEIASTVNNQHAFSLKVSPYVYEIFSSSIYQYKIAAIVRELSTNAVDSHREAGYPERPFKVNLPHKLHPFFEVIDNGVGLSEDDVYDIFTVYFESLKRGSNEDIGGFGVGAKTPLAYTNSFTITTTKNGICCKFAAYLGSDRCPVVSLLSKEETSAENGVKISVPVKESDFATFINEATFIYSFFDTPPEVSPRIVTSIPREEYQQFKDNGYLLTNRYIYSDCYRPFGFYIVMGGVCYKTSIPIKGVKTKYGDITLKDIFYIYANADIGDFPVTISRESISYVEGVQERVESLFVSTIERALDKLFDDVKNMGVVDRISALGELLSEDSVTKIINRKFIRMYMSDIFQYRDNKLCAVAARPQLSVKSMIRRPELKIKVFYSEKGRKSNYRRLMRLTNIPHGSLCIALREKVTEVRLNRLKRYLGEGRVEFINLDAVKDKRKTSGSKTDNSAYACYRIHDTDGLVEVVKIPNAQHFSSEILDNDVVVAIDEDLVFDLREGYTYHFNNVRVPYEIYSIVLQSCIERMKKTQGAAVWAVLKTKKSSKFIKENSIVDIGKQVEKFLGENFSVNDVDLYYLQAALGAPAKKITNKCASIRDIAQILLRESKNDKIEVLRDRLNSINKPMKKLLSKLIVLSSSLDFIYGIMEESYPLLACYNYNSAAALPVDDVTAYIKAKDSQV